MGWLYGSPEFGRVSSGDPEARLSAPRDGSLTTYQPSTQAAPVLPPGADGTISGCYDNFSGSLRVIDTDAGDICDAATETQLNWNQLGRPGPLRSGRAPLDLLVLPDR